VASVGVAWLCGCGPVVAVDDAGAGDPSSSSGDDESGDEATGASVTVSGTATMPPPPGTTVGSSVTDPTGADTGDASSTGELVSCDEIERESIACITIDQSSVVLVGLDSWKSCIFRELQEDVFASSLAWEANEIVACNDSTRWIERIDLATGGIEHTDVPCAALARHPQGFLVMDPFPGAPLRLYASFESIVIGEAIAEFAIEPFAERLAVSGETLYGAWHATEFVEVWDLASSEHVQDMTLDGYSGSVDGLSAIGNVLYLLGDDGIRGYETTSASLLTDVPIDGFPFAHGLACR
jgi:hypothetical protein